MRSKQAISRKSPRAAAGRVSGYRGTGRKKRSPSPAWGIIPYGLGVVCIIFAALRWLIGIPLFNSPEGLLVLLTLCLIVAGALMLLGIFLISRREERRRRETPHPARGPGAAESSSGLQELMDSIDISLDKLKALNEGIHKQTLVLTALAGGYGQIPPGDPENPAPAEPGPDCSPGKRVYLFYNSRFTEHDFDVFNPEEHLN